MKVNLIVANACCLLAWVILAAAAPTYALTDTQAKPKTAPASKEATVLLDAPHPLKTGDADVNSANASQSNRTGKTTEPTSVDQSGQSDADAAPVSVNLFAYIRVPHNQQPVDQCTAYPYPVRPPKIVYVTDPISVKRKDLKGRLVSSEYSARASHSYPYPPGGWRWTYAVQAAERRIGEGVPHTLIELYPWVDRMIPAIRPELERLNRAESIRLQRYADTLSYYEHNYLDVQTDSTRKGLFAQDMGKIKPGTFYTSLTTGIWWVSASRKVPGLQYWWLLPVTIGRGESQTVELNESNALLIQGGW